MCFFLSIINNKIGNLFTNNLFKIKSIKLLLYNNNLERERESVCVFIYIPTSPFFNFFYGKKFPSKEETLKLIYMNKKYINI
jgi:hypothetical protein